MVSHGYRWIDYCQVDEATERAHIRQAVDTLTKLTGSRPLGWMTGRPGAAPGIVGPLRPQQLIEISILGFGVRAHKTGYAGHSTTPKRDRRPHPVNRFL